MTSPVWCASPCGWVCFPRKADQRIADCLLYGERKNVCSSFFLKDDSHGFASGVLQPFFERGETSRNSLSFERSVGGRTRFFQRGWRSRTDGGSQLLPGRRAFGNIESDEFPGWNGEAHVLRVRLRPGGNADNFTPIVEDRAPTVSRGDGTRQLILHKAVHAPNLADQSIADAKIVAFGRANHISSRPRGLQFAAKSRLPMGQSFFQLQQRQIAHAVMINA